MKSPRDVSPDNQRREITRRRFIGEAGVATIGAAGVLAAPGLAGTPTRKRRKRQTVAVFGGGIAGLTAAHELIGRGFDVAVYERRAWGGKARSTEVPRSARGGRRPLPGEHGWRAFFGFYQNIVDTMHRIPFEGNSGGTFDNLVPAPEVLFSRQGRRDLAIPLGAPDPRPFTPEKVHNTVAGLLLESDLPPGAITHFANRLVVFLASCDARRIGQWENISWSDFIGASRYPKDYTDLLVTPFTQFTQASKGENTSAEFPGHLFELLIYTTAGIGANGPFLRILDRPTNEAFIDPWMRELRGLGVELKGHSELLGLEMSHGRIDGAQLRDARGPATAHADWYVMALPVERARRLWTRPILKADPTLALMDELDTGWFSGLKLFLAEELPIARGLVAYLNSPWCIESVSQAQFWPADFAETYGDGRVHESLSVNITRWDTRGILHGKSARYCSPRELVDEVWEQIRRHLSDSGEGAPRRDLVLSWALDPGLIRRNGRFRSEDPLVLPSVGSRAVRPAPGTRIPNLALTGDYLDGDWEVANMEAANYNGRRAANVVLERARSREAPCSVTDTYRPPEWEPAKKIDEDRYRRGLPNVLDLG